MNYGDKAPKLANLGKHLLCWSLFITYEISVAYSFSGKFSPFFDYAGHYALNIGLFYLTILLTFKTTLDGVKRRYALLAVLILLEFVLYLLVKYTLETMLFRVGIYAQNIIPVVHAFVIQSIWRFLYFFGISAGYWFAHSQIRQSKVIADLEKQQLVSLMEKQAFEKELIIAENSYLKAQINPHFMFNALGFIHNQVYKISEKAGEVVTVLADMMRYALGSPQMEDQVLLSEEIEHIENYILINQHRFNNQLQLKFSYSEDVVHISILPLLLITIVENVFKYGELIQTEIPATIALSSKDGQLVLDVRNEKSKKPRYVSSGIGMSNVIKRLDVHYPSKYSLQVNESEHQYHLHLIIAPND